MWQLESSKVSKKVELYPSFFDKYVEVRGKKALLIYHKLPKQSFLSL
jgi:hypothetical protein